MNEFPAKGRVYALNKGEASGNLNHSAGIDFSTEPGRILSSPNAYNVFDQSDSATFDNPMGSLITYGNRWFGGSDAVFRGGSNSADTPRSGWAIDGTASTPTLDWDESDAVVFDDLYLVSGVSGGGDIYAYNGSAWSSWWTGTLGQSALVSSGFKPMKVGATGRLYILDSQNKVYNVTTAGSVTKTGNGTLDFSSTSYKFICMQPTSTRMWLGGLDNSTGESVVAEWDMSLNESTANRLYKLPAHGVVNILIWEDQPVVVLSDGTLRFFDGYQFVEKDGARLPTPPAGYSFKGDAPGNALPAVTDFIIHPNGSAIIDDVPHFFFNALVNKEGAASSPTPHPAIYSGIYCFDPAIGLYNRFPIELDGGTTGFGAYASSVGALSPARSVNTKFLASCLVKQNGATKAVLFSDDGARSVASRGRFVLNPLWGAGRDVWQKVETLATAFKNSSDRVLLKYRFRKSASMPFPADVTWTSTTVFTSTEANLANAAVGDWVLVSIGNGAGCTAHISTISESTGTYTVTLDEAVTGVSSTDTGSVIVDNWKRFYTIAEQNRDYHSYDVPDPKQSHTFWLMVETRSAAGSVVEIDKHIISNKSS